MKQAPRDGTRPDVAIPEGARSTPPAGSAQGVPITPTVVVGDGAGPRDSRVVRSTQPDLELPLPPAVPSGPQPASGVSAGATGGRGDPPSGTQPLLREDERWFHVFDTLGVLPRDAELATVLDLVVELLAGQIPCAAVGAAAYEPAHGTLRYLAVRGEAATPWLGVRVAPTAGLLAEALRAEQPLRVAHDVRRARGFLPAVDGCPGLVTRNLVLRPLHDGERLLGLLHLVNRSGPLSFADAEVDLVQYVAERLARAWATAPAVRHVG